MIISLILVMIIIIIILLYFKNRREELFHDDLYDNMQMYVINLKSRIDKKKYMEDQLNKHKLDHIFFEAIDGNKLDLDKLYKGGMIDPNKSIAYIKRKLRRGEIGCYLSHISVWSQFLNSGKQYAVIFEDDVILCNDFKDRLYNIIKEADEINWDILYLNENCYRHFGKNCNGEHVTANIIKPKNIGYGNYGYVIKRDTIIKYMNGVIPIILPIDDYLLRKQKHRDNQILRLKDPIVLVDRKFSSDTQSIK